MGLDPLNVAAQFPFAWVRLGSQHGCAMLAFRVSQFANAQLRGLLDPKAICVGVRLRFQAVYKEIVRPVFSSLRRLCNGSWNIDRIFSDSSAFLVNLNRCAASPG